MPRKKKTEPGRTILKNKIRPGSMSVAEMKKKEASLEPIFTSSVRRRMKSS